MEEKNKEPLADKNEMLLVLDEEGNSTGKIMHRKEVHDKLIYHNEVSCIVINTKKEILLQKRSKNKKSFPGCWALCAGHVVGYQDIKDAILIEMNEELVMEIKDKNIFQLIPTIKNEREDNKCFVTCFCAIINKKADEFLIQPEELEEVKWFTLDEFRDLIKNEKGTIFKNNDYYNEIIKALEKLFNSNELNRIYAQHLEQIEEYDDEEQPTGKLLTREFAHNFGIWHKGASLFIINEHNEVLLQKRSANKIRNPYLWDFSVAGHVLFGETDVNTLLRESKEEIGYDLNIKDVKHLIHFKEKVIFNKMYKDNTIINVYVARINAENVKFTPERYEIDELKFTSMEELKDMMKDYKNLTYIPQAYEALIDYMEKDNK